MFELGGLLIYSIQGCIFPSSHSISCGLEVSSAPPSLESVTQCAPLDDLKTSLDQYEELTNLPLTHPLYWKPKLILQVLNAPSVVSVSFIPLNRADSSVLFIQKGIVEKGITGFFAPYLTEEQQEQWNATTELPNIHPIQNEDSIDQSLTGLEQEVFQEIKDCLKYFLLDSCTQAIALTYETAAGICSRSWIKV
jgi:hypothetical protein